MEKLLEYLNSLIKKYTEDLESINKEINNNSELIEKDINKVKSIKKSNSSLSDFTDIDIMNLTNKLSLDDDLLDEEDINEVLTNSEYDHSSARRNILFVILQSKYLSMLNEQLDEEQLMTLRSFVNDLLEILKKESLNNRENNIKVKRIKERVDELSKGYQEFINAKSLKKIVTNHSFINRNIVESDLSLEEKRNILIEIINYNKSVYDEFMLSYNKKITSEPEEIERLVEVLDEDEVNEILNKYGLSLSNLVYVDKKGKEDRTYLDYVLGNSTYENIDSVLGLLVGKYKIEEKQFDRTNKERVRTLANLLAKSNVETIEEVLNTLYKYGYGIKHLLKHPIFMIKQSEDTKYRPNIIGGEEEDSPSLAINGKSKNLLKNINFFESNGFDVSNIIDKAMPVLATNTNFIKYNFELMKLYDFPFTKKEEKKVGSYFAFDAVHAADIIDRFIEMDSGGYNYICNNMSRIRIANPNHSLFYRMYYEFKKNNFGVRASILRYINTRDSEDMTQEQKNIIGGTITVPINNKEEYDRIVLEKINQREFDAINNKVDMSKGNLLFDYDILDNQIVKDINARYSTPDYSYKYDLDGVIISKNKFLKVFNALKDKVNENNIKDILMYSFTYNSIINEDEYNIIKKQINELVNSRKLG